MGAGERLIEEVWWGDGTVPRLGRVALAPLSTLYGAVTGLRNALYDRRLLTPHPLVLPAVSVGNLTVGGTGKTPVASWIADALRARGCRPAIVMRGYGGDEPLVHERLTPGVPVICDAHRVRGVRAAQAAGADVAVLDDAFQHRRARRDADIVLLSADRWTGAARLLPAGPHRDPMSALRRAELVLVTRKGATDAQVEATARAAHAAAPGVPVAVGALRLGGLEPARRGAGMPAALQAVRGRRLLAIAAIGDPAAFVRQLDALGADVELARFPDHHPFADHEVHDLATRADAFAREGGLTVCTLKDAVKLAPRWPRAAPPLWYVSQRLYLERGGSDLDRLLDRLAALRHARLSSAG